MTASIGRLRRKRNDLNDGREARQPNELDMIKSNTIRNATHLRRLDSQEVYPTMAKKEVEYPGKPHMAEGWTVSMSEQCGHLNIQNF